MGDFEQHCERMAAAWLEANAQPARKDAAHLVQPFIAVAEQVDRARAEAAGQGCAAGRPAPAGPARLSAAP